MAANDLTTLANAQSWVPGLDSTIGARLISAISTQIQNWVSYNFTTQSYTRTFNGRGETRLMLPDYPITAVASLSIDGVSIAAAADATSCGFVFDEKTIYLRGYRFCRGVQNVAIAYTAGYATVPLDVEQACLEWLKSSWERFTTRAAGVSMMKAGGSQIEWGADAFMAGNELIAPMPASVYALLQPYARVYVA